MYARDSASASKLLGLVWSVQSTNKPVGSLWGLALGRDFFGGQFRGLCATALIEAENEPRQIYVAHWVYLGPWVGACFWGGVWV